MGKEPRSGTCRKLLLHVGEPSRLDIERQDDARRCARLVRVGMRFPGIDQYGGIVTQGAELIPDREEGVGSGRLDQDVAMRVRVVDQHRIHVQERYPPELPLEYPESLGHSAFPHAGAGSAGPFSDLYLFAYGCVVRICAE